MPWIAICSPRFSDLPLALHNITMEVPQGVSQKKIKRDKKVTREANKKARKCNRISLEKTNAEINFFYINSLVVTIVLSENFTYFLLSQIKYSKLICFGIPTQFFNWQSLIYILTWKKVEKSNFKSFGQLIPFSKIRALG